MLHRVVQHVTIPLLEENNAGLSDEYFFKESLKRLINDVALDELKKIFRMRKLDPREPDPYPSTEEAKIRGELLSHLRQRQVVQFEISIVTQD